jgi:hypothetical protein
MRKSLTNERKTLERGKGVRTPFSRQVNPGRQTEFVADAEDIFRHKPKTMKSNIIVDQIEIEASSRNHRAKDETTMISMRV